MNAMFLAFSAAFEVLDDAHAEWMAWCEADVIADAGGFYDDLTPAPEKIDPPVVLARNMLLYDVLNDVINP